MGNIHGGLPTIVGLYGFMVYHGIYYYIFKVQPRFSLSDITVGLKVL